MKGREFLMANPEHLEILKQGVEVWNRWRKENPGLVPDISNSNLRKISFRNADLKNANLNNSDLFACDLRSVDLGNANLVNADLSYTNLSDAILIKANLKSAFLKKANCFNANFSNANLNSAILTHSDFHEANLSNADLRNAKLFCAQLDRANLSNADLRKAILSAALLVGTNLSEANLTNCTVYGISVWNVKLSDTIQKDLIITPLGAPKITVDNLEVAQFIYLLLHNEKIREVIDTITSKVVLILGRFSPERKFILDTIREELRTKNYTPVLFDFQEPSSRDRTETISTLAHMARFIIADITDARSIPQELRSIVPNLPSVPVQPLLQSREDEYGMFEHFRSYHWVLTLHRYRDLAELVETLGEKVIAPAEAKLLAQKKDKDIRQVKPANLRPRAEEKKAIAPH